MSKTLFGGEGKYEIYNETCIIQQKYDNNKELINKFKIFNNVELIPNSIDKVSIQRIIDYEFRNKLNIKIARA